MTEDMPHITFVKKILVDGSLCKKCQEVSERLERDGLMHLINHVVIADEGDASSEGVRLAQQHKVGRAPFFLVETQDEDILVFDIYFKLKKYLADLGFSTTESASL